MSKWTVSSGAGGGGGGVSLTDPASQITSPDGVSKASVWQQFPTRPQRPPSKIISRFPAGHGWTGGTDDLTVKLFTDRTLRGTIGATDLNFGSPGAFATPVDMSASSIRIWVRTDDPTAVGQIIVWIRSTGGSNFYNSGISGNIIAGEWVPLTIPRAAFGIAVGTPNWASVDNVSVVVQRAGGSTSTTANFWFGGFELVPDLAATYPNGVMVVEFDDGYAGQLANGLPVLAQRGIPATFNVISERFLGGSPAAGMTPADLRTLQDTHGWQVSCHAYASAAHGSVVNPVATMEADFQREKHWLHANGLHSGANDLALCPGTGSPVAQGAMMDAIRRSFRSVRVNSGPYETANYADPLRLRSLLFTGESTSTMQVHINKTAGAGGAFIFTMHDVIAGATNGTSNGLASMAATNLATTLDYAISKGMVFRTRADLIDGR